VESYLKKLHYGHASIPNAVIFKKYISDDSVAIHFRCGKMFHKHFMQNFQQAATANKFLKLMSMFGKCIMKSYISLH